MQASTQGIYFDGSIKKPREKVHSSTIQPVAYGKRLHGNHLQEREPVQSNSLKRVEIRSE